MTRSVRFFLILGIGLLILDATLLLIGRRSSELYRGATAISTGTAAIGGPFTLVATDGTAVTDASYRGKWMLIYFGYTFCPDACPAALANVSAALKMLGNEADKVQPLFITVDPKRDTRQVLGEYLKSFDPRIIGLTGSEEQNGCRREGVQGLHRVKPRQSQGRLSRRPQFLCLSHGSDWKVHGRDPRRDAGARGWPCNYAN
jgi:cytochrome oxidase Cu insertion factor (SCO1/SenC/PrrC family)